MECNQPQTRCDAIIECFFPQELKRQESQTKGYRVKEGAEKGFIVILNLDKLFQKQYVTVYKGRLPYRVLQVVSLALLADNKV